MPLTVTTATESNGVQVLTLNGNMTLGRDAQHFEWLVRDLVAQRRNRIVVDLTGVGYVDSAGIGILVGSHGAVLEAGGEMRLAGVNGRVAKVLAISQVDSILNLDPNPEEALRTLAASV